MFYSSATMFAPRKIWSLPWHSPPPKEIFGSLMQGCVLREKKVRSFVPLRLINRITRAGLNLGNCRRLLAHELLRDHCKASSSRWQNMSGATPVNMSIFEQGSIACSSAFDATAEAV